MYQWYSGNLNAALRNFNNARADTQWEKAAICNMIEICLNPEDEMLGDQFFDGDDSEYRDSRTMALKTGMQLFSFYFKCFYFILYPFKATQYKLLKYFVEELH